MGWGGAGGALSRPVVCRPSRLRWLLIWSRLVGWRTHAGAASSLHRRKGRFWREERGAVGRRLSLASLYMYVRRDGRRKRGRHCRKTGISMASLRCDLAAGRWRRRYVHTVPGKKGRGKWQGAGTGPGGRMVAGASRAGQARARQFWWGPPPELCYIGFKKTPEKPKIQGPVLTRHMHRHDLACLCMYVRRDGRPGRIPRGGEVVGWAGAPWTPSRS